MSSDSIWKFEIGKTTMLSKQLKKIATFLNVPIEELSKEIKEETKECKSKPCLNQICLLNKECYCQSDQVIEGAYCKNENEASNPVKAVKFNNTSALFAK